MQFVHVMALGLAQGAIFSLAAFPVRTQLSLFKNFDFSIAAAILVASETFTVVARAIPFDGEVRALLGSGAGVSAAIVVMVCWNGSFERLARRAAGGREPNLFVVSLGLSVAVAGFVGLVRGPGLRQSDLNDLGRVMLGREVSLDYPVAYAFAMAAVVLGTAFVWLRSRSGLPVLLLSGDPAFAREIGIDRRELVVPAGIMSGFAAGAVGSYYALSSGSTIELGSTLFLYGAGAALIFNGMRSFVWGGLVLGVLLVWLQQILAPAWATAVMFAGVVALVTFRGSSRLRQGLR
jgi:ribose/xylose/arabinose/galactoside ABC-type transport system permease subunit